MKKEKELALGEATNVTRCPLCQSKVEVIDSRESVHGWRRVRQCINCDYKYSTVEVLTEEYNNNMKKILFYDKIAENLRDLMREGI